jgi:hypothetical protein
MRQILAREGENTFAAAENLKDKKHFSSFFVSSKGLFAALFSPRRVFYYYYFNPKSKQFVM